MIEKPTRRQELKVTSVIKGTLFQTIYFYGSSDAASDAMSFGLVEPAGLPEWYRLEVDGRFDFDEVLDYLENYG